MFSDKVPISALATVIQILSSELTCPVGASKQNDWGKVYITVKRLGSHRYTPVTNSANVLVECYAENELDSERLADLAESVLRSSVQKRQGNYYLTYWDTTQGPTSLRHPEGLHRHQFIGIATVPAR
ncbi:head-to-tail connector complex protein [Gordonia phage Ronaldo]|uniref:Tail terminator n=3 Tax=Ronaldovirus ronaldo TaxID=2734270 RepID=A0A6B9L8A7_9CAUD|nr:head-to-tail connector complex protein [Gordonia phage Ronaldo]AXN53609.1 tail terminator [Gordonia phage Ronaldo]QDH48386.1 tail terminator [Gordonia phage Ziko]QHB38162.1 tail terminator [Gordonia phage Volt]QTF81834.1 tail terminator [Gordonia phage Guey18]